MPAAVDPDVPTDQAEPPPSAPRFPIGWWVSATVIAVLLYAVFVFAGDLRSVAGEFRRLRPLTIAVVVVAVSLGYVLRAIRWHVFVAPWSPRPEFVGSALAFVAGFAMGITPGKVGELVKIYYQWDRDGTAVSASTGATLAERGLDVLVLLLLMALGFTIAPPGTGWVVAVLVVAALMGLSLVRSLGFVRTLTRSLGRVRFLARILGHVERSHAALRSSLTGRRLAWGLALGMGAWALEPFAMMLFARDLGIGLSYPAAAFVFAAGSLVSVLTLIPGGLGVFEGGSILLLTTLTDATLSQATALTLLIRLATLWYGVVLGAICIAVLRFQARARAATVRAAEA